MTRTLTYFFLFSAAMFFFRWGIIHLWLLQLFFGAAMGTQGSSKIFTKGYTSHYAKFKPAYVQDKLLYKEIQMNKVSFVLPLNARMGVKLKHLVKSGPYLKCSKEAKVVSCSEAMNTHMHTHTQSPYQTRTKYQNLLSFLQNCLKKKELEFCDFPFLGQCFNGPEDQPSLIVSHTRKPKQSCYFQLNQLCRLSI